MPDVTVAMPARNAAAFIGEAIRSIRAQEGIDWELVIVDDASTDGTAAVVSGFHDSRISLLVHDRRRGIAACHNAILDRGRAPFVAHVDADDVIRPGALRTMVDALKQSPRCAQAYAHFLFIDARGSVVRTGLARHRRYLRSRERESFDYRRLLLVHGMVVNTLRTYRREVFDAVGRFNEALPVGIDLEMALRIADRYDMLLVPRVLYLVRMHQGNSTSYTRPSSVRQWISRYRMVRRVLGERPALLGHRPAAIHGLMFIGLLHALGIPRRAKAVARHLSVARSTSS